VHDHPHIERQARRAGEDLDSVDGLAGSEAAPVGVAPARAA